MATSALAAYGSGHFSAVFTISLIYHSWLKAWDQIRLHPPLPLMSSAQRVLGLDQQPITGHLYISITADLLFNDISASHIQLIWIAHLIKFVPSIKYLLLNISSTQQPIQPKPEHLKGPVKRCNHLKWNQRLVKLLPWKRTLVCDCNDVLQSAEAFDEGAPRPQAEHHK